MEVSECVRSRLTVRDFKPDPVPDRVVTKLLQAARWAPSSRNRQPWQFVVIQGRETLERIGQIASSGAYIAQAPVAIADRKSTRLNSSHSRASRMPSSA